MKLNFNSFNTANTKHNDYNRSNVMHAGMFIVFLIFLLKATISVGQVYATLNLTVIHQGYYCGYLGNTCVNNNGLMQQVLYNEGVDTNPNSTNVDTVTISLVDTNYGNFIATSKGVLQTNGSLTVIFNGSVIGNSYYIYVQHRNCVRTSSANPVKMLLHTTYDFSSSASQAYGNNEVEVDVGVWAIYTADINQDEFVDSWDAAQFETDLSNHLQGYVNSDLNGDGIVDLYDYPVLNLNVSDEITANVPF